MKRVPIVAIMAAAVLLALAIANTGIGPVWIYGRPGVTDNGGIEMQLQETGCGLELWGHPGFFCDNGLDASGQVHGQ